MNAARNMIPISLAISVAVLIAAWLSVESRAQSADKPALAGAWTQNKDLSDQPGTGRDAGDRGGRDGGGYGRGGGRRGGFGGGFGGGGYGRGGGRMGNMDPQEMARIRDAMRDLVNPPEHLTIAQTDSMIILTGPDGRTTRLSPDGKKVKDENTKIERKTKWDGSKLVSEISGAGPGKMTQTFEVDGEKHLRITLVRETRGGQPRTTTTVYDADAAR